MRTHKHKFYQLCSNSISFMRIFIGVFETLKQVIAAEISIMQNSIWPKPAEFFSEKAPAYIGCCNVNFNQRFSPFQNKEYQYNRLDKPGPKHFTPERKKTDKSTDTLVFTKAVWHEKERKFVVEGFTSACAIVNIYNSSTENKVGKVTVGSDGYWRLVIKKPVTVPCSVLVVCQDHDFQCSVKNAPSLCI